MSLKGKDVLSLIEFTPDEIYLVLSRAMELKRLRVAGVPHRTLEGKTIALIFDKPSTRTRVSFEAAIAHLGASSITLSARDMQTSRGETIEDTGRTLSRYVDGIVIRTHEHSRVEALAEVSAVPVINGLSDDFHPCQALADLMTILEEKDRLAGIKLAYVGDGNNVANSLLVAAGKVGLSISVATPRGYEPPDRVVNAAMDCVRDVTHKVAVMNDAAAAVKDADAVYTDVWVSMGQEEERRQRMQVFADYQVNAQLLAHAKPDVIVMHCLPAHRGDEITADVIDGPRSVVFDEAENRLHVQKALLSLLVAG